MFDIKQELKKLPELPGVYLMKNDKDEIIYVGKAKVLKNRVNSYFTGIDNHDKKTYELVSNIKSFEYIVTSNEIEALVLECNLIKKYYPKYNIMFKDSRGYPYIKVILNEQFPRVIVTREYRRDNNKYFGPFVDSKATYEVMDLLEKLFPTRKCNKVFPRDLGVGRPCLNYQIGKCPAPCNYKISKEDYDQNITEIVNFLSGDTEKIENDLRSKMIAFSEDLNFELAADCRDKLLAIQKLREKQTMEKDNDNNIDIIGIANNGKAALVQIFFVRKGKMLGRDQFVITDNVDEPNEKIVSEFIKQYYNDMSFIPPEIIVGVNITDNSIKEMLETYIGSKVDLKIALKGDKAKYLKMANDNAKISLFQFGENLVREQKRTVGALEEIQLALGVEKPLTRIESYDISNVQGYENVGSMVVFVNGKPKRDDYRKFKIKTVIGADDYASMKEVITRRLNRFITEQELEVDKRKFNDLPDAFFVDGGLGHVNIVKNVLDELGFNNILVIGLVKDDKHRTRGMIFEGEEIILDKNSEGFKLITRIQDEVHRFALEYHKKLRQKGIHTVIDRIDGVGKAKRNALLRHFGDIEKIKNASKEELLEVDGISDRVADNILSFFHNQKNNNG